MCNPMKVTESDFSNQILAYAENKFANIFFFNHIAVVEINEGVHLDRNNASEVIDELITYFGEKKPFGVVANRIHSYSVNLLDTPNYKEKVKNLQAYGVVGHDLASKMNAEMESSFCASENVVYDTLYDAINAVYNKIKKGNLFTLN